MNKCVSCKKDNELDSSFCIYCGTKLLIQQNNVKSQIETNLHTCKTCKKQIDDDSTFCEHCGTQLMDLNYQGGNLTPYELYDKWGFKDLESRNVVVPAKYSSANSFKNDRAVVIIDDKYSIVNQDGKELCLFKYDFISDYEYSYTKVKRDDKWALIDKYCKELTPFKFDDIELFDKKIIVGKFNNKEILLSDKGQQISKSEYDIIYKFDNSIAKVEQNSKFGLINEQGVEILSCEYDSIENFEDDLAKISKDGLYGYVDISGELIIPCDYNSLNNFNEDLIRTQINNTYGLINWYGKNILLSEYNTIDNFNDDLIIVSVGEKYGLINHTGEFILNCQYDEIKILSENSIIARSQNEWLCFDQSGIDITSSDNEFKQKNKRNKTRKKAGWASIIILIVLCLTIYDFSTNAIGIVRKTQILIYGRAEVDWKDIMANNPSQLLLYENYIHKYPNGKYFEKAKLIIDSLQSVNDTRAFSSALYANTSKEYKLYLKNYPRGKYISQATKKLDFINAKGKNNGYQAFIRKYPDSKEAKSASKIIENNVWMQAKESDNISQYIIYINLYPSGDHFNEAEEIIFWKNTRSLQEYLTKYPNGLYSKQAIDIYLSNSICGDCNGNGKCSLCNGSGIFGTEQKLVYDPCPKLSKLFGPMHGKRCKTCGGDRMINEHYITIDSKCKKCNESGVCIKCNGIGRIQNEWFNSWYARYTNCRKCSSTGSIMVRSDNQHITCTRCRGTGKTEWLDEYFVCSECDGKKVIRSKVVLKEKAPCPTCNLILNKK